MAMCCSSRLGAQARIIRVARSRSSRLMPSCKTYTELEERITLQADLMALEVKPAARRGVRAQSSSSEGTKTNRAATLPPSLQACRSRAIPRLPWARAWTSSTTATASRLRPRQIEYRSCRTSQTTRATQSSRSTIPSAHK